VVIAGAQELESIGLVFERQRLRALALRTSSAAMRIATLHRLEAEIFRRRTALYAALQEDLHKPEAEVDLSELMPVIQEIRHACRHLEGWMAPRRVRPTRVMLGTRASVRAQPRGVALIIAPWNYPFNLALGPLVSAIAAGCTAIIKPSEFAPHTAALIAAIVAACFETDEVALFEGDAAMATALLDLPFDHIFFTGSPAVGKIVMAAAARHLSSVTLELGGKSPVIVDRTADLDKAARSIVWGKFANNGQTCIAPDHAYVHRDCMTPFIEAARRHLTKMYGEGGRSPDYCRIVTPQHFERIRRLIEDARARGATVHVGGIYDATDKFIAPTLLSGVPADALIMHEEIFGPVLPIVPFDDVGEPIRAINAQPKPLALYVFSEDAAAAERIIAETAAGGSCVNAVMAQYLHANLPFGGINNSGIGSAHGHYGFRAFSHERAVLKDRFSATPMLFPPYSPRVRRMIKLIVRFLT